jgi:hypothetical protein
VNLGVKLLAQVPKALIIQSKSNERMKPKASPRKVKSRNNRNKQVLPNLTQNVNRVEFKVTKKRKLKDFA